jgi:hypothetical protein
MALNHDLNKKALAKSHHLPHKEKCQYEMASIMMVFIGKIRQ